MKNITNNLCLLIILGVLTQSCGTTQSAQQATISTVQAAPTLYQITLLNSGTQDASYGSQLSLPFSMTSNVPASIVRIQGSTAVSGIGVGVDFGNSLGQCFYYADVNNSAVFILSSCNGGLAAGTPLYFAQGQIITMWSYNHVNSTNSVVELVMNGITQ